MIYGPQGIGKTTLIGSAVDVAGMGDLFIINADAGDLVLTDNDRVKNPDRIVIATTTTFRQVGFMYEWLSAHCKARDENNTNRLKELESQVTGIPVAEIETPRKFYSVGIDSMTEVEAMNMYALLEVDDNKLLEGSSDDIEVADWGDFRRNKMMVELLVRRFKNLPMHLFLVCHESWRQDEMKRNMYTPQLTGKLVNSIQGMVDIVGFLRKAPVGTAGEEIRRLFVQPDRMFAAKCRIAGFKGQHFDNPTMASIMTAIGLQGTK